MRRVILANLLLVVMAWALLAWAATATVAPGGDTTTDGWTTTPLFSKINEDIDSPNGTVIVSSNNPATPANNIVFSMTCPADVDTITAANLRIRARERGNSARTISLTAVWSPTAATNVTTGTMSSTMTNFASGSQTVSVSKATCDASTFTVQPTTSGTGPAENAEIDTINLDITYTPQTDNVGPRKRMLIPMMAVPR